MEGMQEEGGQRDWAPWFDYKAQLEVAYRDEEEYWARKARNDWAKEGDNNKKFFHAVIAQRGCRNRIDRLELTGGGYCEGDQAGGEVISDYFSNLFTSSTPVGGGFILDGI